MFLEGHEEREVPEVGGDVGAIGAFADSTDEANAGSVYVLAGSPGGLLLQGGLRLSPDLILGAGASALFEFFGDALAAADFDGDGADDLAAGSPGEDVLGNDDGAVTVIMGAIGTGFDPGTSRARQVNHGLEGIPGTASEDGLAFGSPLAAGGFDGDGHADLAIGAPNEDESFLPMVGTATILYGALFADGFEDGFGDYWSSVAAATSERNAAGPNQPTPVVSARLPGRAIVGRRRAIPEGTRGGIMPDPIDGEYLRLLQQRSVLTQQFSAAELEALCGVMSLRRFRQDETLSREGEPADSAMVLLEGLAHVVVSDQRVATLEAGDFFGESAFSEDARRKAAVIARADGVAAELTTEAFESFIALHPRLAWKFQRFFDTLRAKNTAFNERFFHKDDCRYVALLAHNDKKAELIELVKRHRWFFDTYPLVAAGTTGTALYQSTGITLSRKVSSGPLGGDQVIGSMVASDNILAVIFFRDPLSPHAHHADVEALGRVCDVYRVPFATNSTTAEAVLRHLAVEAAATAEAPDESLAKYERHQAKVIEQLGGDQSPRVTT